MMARNKAWISLAIIFFALPTTMTQTSAPYCIPKTPSKDHLPFPKLDMAAFTVEYRANIIDKNYTMRAKEYYDYKHNKVRLDILKNGLRQGVLFDYEDNTYILYNFLNPEETDYQCLIQQLDKAEGDNFDIFGFSKGNNASPIPHVLSSQDILQFAADQQHEYKGETLLGGLNVTHWQSCVSWQDVNATFTLDYYFTHPDFKALGDLTPRQIPVRAEVNGAIDEQGKRRTFHHIYEYLNVRSFDTLPPETFSLPDFMICQGETTKWKHHFPTLPESMSYTVERVSSESNGNRNRGAKIEVVSVFEDAKRKLVRTDHIGVTSISDFSTGVEYIINQHICSPGPINPKNVVSASEENGLIKMKDRPEIAYLKREFHFTGPKLFREISALAFAGVKQESKEALQAYVADAEKTLIGLVVKNTFSGSETYYNMFNFVNTAYPSHDDKDPFDIRRCTDSNKITEFDITVQYETDYRGHIKDWSAEIISGLRDYISEVVDCSILQISNKDYHINENEKEFQWSGFFLGTIPNLKRAKVENQLPIPTYEDFISVLFESIQNGEFEKKILLRATNFIKVVGKNLKSKGTDYQPIGVRQNPLSKFSHVNDFCVKNFDDFHQKRVFNSVYDCAKDCLKSQWVGCNVFQYSESSKECTTSMQKSLPALASTPGCDFYTLEYLSHFEKFPGALLLESEDVLHKEASTEEVCARMCLQEGSFQCESFDFCEEEDRCQLYKTHYYDTDSNPSLKGEAVISCMHYSRKSLDDFTEVRSTDLTLPGQTTEVETKSLQECAYLCKEDCVMFSSCVVDQRLVCKFVQASAVDTVKYEYDVRCSVHNAPDFKSKISLAKSRDTQTNNTFRKTSRSSSSGSQGYTGGAMIGLGAAMVVTGVGVGVITILLLRYFKIWEGF